jgi:L-asparaginase
MNDWQPLVEYQRLGLAECTIHGSIAWVRGNQLIHSLGGNPLCYGRSTMKPYMMKVFAEALRNLTSEQKAISVSSHNAEEIHLQAVKSILSASELELVKTPPSLPLMQASAIHLKPHPLFHSCSGEHAALVKGCQALRWPVENYISRSHPFFTAYLNEIRSVLGQNWQPKFTAKDGCGLPTFSMTVQELAQLFSALAQNRQQDWIWDAMAAHPDLVGGTGRLDSAILKACQGKVLAKEGADGLLGLSVVHSDFPEGLGIFVKIAHGWNMRAAWVVARAALGVLGFGIPRPPALLRQESIINELCLPASLRPKLAALSAPEEKSDRADFT